MRNCRTCAIGVPAPPDGSVYCHKLGRVIPPDDAARDWGCLYFAEPLPGEGLGPAQYVLLKETELRDKK